MNRSGELTWRKHKQIENGQRLRQTRGVSEVGVSRGGTERECWKATLVQNEKAIKLGWQRRVLQEESQSAEPNEPGLENTVIGDSFRGAAFTVSKGQTGKKVRKRTGV